jgi:hypothetical protein
VEGVAVFTYLERKRIVEHKAVTLACIIPVNRCHPAINPICINFHYAIPLIDEKQYALPVMR